MTVWRFEICQYLLLKLKLELYVKLMWYVKKRQFYFYHLLADPERFKELMVFALKPTIIKRPAKN